MDCADLHSLNCQDIRALCALVQHEQCDWFSLSQEDALQRIAISLNRTSVPCQRKHFKLIALHLAESQVLALHLHSIDCKPKWSSEILQVPVSLSSVEEYFIFRHKFRNIKGESELAACRWVCLCLSFSVSVCVLHFDSKQSVFQEHLLCLCRCVCICVHK